MTDRTVTARSRRRARIAAVALVGAVVTGGLGTAGAQQVDLDDLRAQREQARQAELEARAAFDVLDAEFEDVEAAYEAADELVRLAESRADTIRQQLEVIEQRMARAEAGIAWAEYDRELVGAEITEIAIREYLGLSDEPNLLAERDPTEALARNAVLDVVQGVGYDALDTARTAADRYVELRDQVEADAAQIARLTAELDAELVDLEQARAHRQAARDTLEGTRSEWLARIDELDRQEADFTAQIDQELARLEAEAARERARDAARAAGRPVADSPASQGYIWPTAGGIGSYFGPRVHPILGISRLHGGLDIGGRMGQPIYAAKEGLVVLVGVNGGYGNTVVLDHGDGFLTLYGHQSSFAVSKGEWVEVGQHIGNVGSTGLSTGPHLHFEIRIDGTVVDPLPYLPPR